MNQFFKLPTRIFIMLSLFLGAICLSACGLNNTKYRYRIVVEVENDGKIYSGSSVWETVFHKQTLSVIDSSSEWSRGEAIVVNMEDKGNLFLLVNISLWGITDKSSADYKFEDHKSWKISKKLIAKFPFATFTDINDPKSVKEVFPFDYEYIQEKRDENGNQVHGANHSPVKETKTQKANFQEYFGQDAKLLSVTIFPTKDPVTYGQVEKTIPWIREDLEEYKKNGKSKLFGSDNANYDIHTFYSNMSFIFFVKE